MDSQKHRKIEAFCLAPKPEARKLHCASNCSQEGQMRLVVTRVCANLSKTLVLKTRAYQYANVKNFSGGSAVGK